MKIYDKLKEHHGYMFFSILFLLVIVFGYGLVYVTGHTLIGKNDDVGQYYETFLYTGEYLRKLFKAGGFHLYDLSIGMGEDVIGCLNYYGFGDPFYLLSVFADAENGHVFFDFLYFFRLYLGGMAFVMYCRQMRLEALSSALSALAYLFASFGLSAVSKIPAWGCVLIFLPLMLTGCERVFERSFRASGAGGMQGLRGSRRGAASGRREADGAKGSGALDGGLILCLSALYAGLCGFYMVYMTGIFLAVYCVVRLSFIFAGVSKQQGSKSEEARQQAAKRQLPELEDAVSQAENSQGSEPKAKARERVHNAPEIFMSCLNCAVWFIAGLLLSAPFLFPAVETYLSSERSDTDILAVLLDYHNYLPSAKFIKETFGYPISGNVYFQGMVVAEFVCAVGVFFIKATDRIRQCRLAVAVSALTFSLPITGYIFNGFGESYTRWAVFIHFIFAVVMAVFLSDTAMQGEGSGAFLAESPEKNSPGREITDKKKGSSGASAQREEGRLQEPAHEAAKGVRLKKIMTGVILVSIPVNLIINAITFFAPFGSNRISKLIRNDAAKLCVDSPVIHSSVIMDDLGLFRVSTEHYSPANERPENAAMLYGYHGLTYWFSMVNGYTQDALNAMTDRKDNWRSYGLSGDGFTETMAGVKYYLTKEEEVPPFYECAEIFTWNGEKWRVYENRHYYGFTYLRDEKGILERGLLSTSGDGTLYQDPDKNAYDRVYGELYDDVISEKGGYIGLFDTDRYAVSVMSDAPDQTAVIAIPYSKNFRVYLDGERVSARCADGMYTAVDLGGAGSHDIIMEYHGKAFMTGLAFSILTLILLVASAFILRRKRKA